MTQYMDSDGQDQTVVYLPTLTIDQLSLGEQLVIWAFRNQLAEGSEKALVRGFHVAFGLSSVEAALASFHGLYNTIFHNCQRDLSFHATRCRCVSRDEILIVNLIAANHAGMSQQARDISRSLVLERAVQDLLDDASTLSLLMQRHDLRMPLRPLPAAFGHHQAVLH